jgi:hypothetical protein
MGLVMMPLNTHLINAAPRKLVSRVTSLTNALMQVVSSLSTAALATILTQRTKTNVAHAQAQIMAQYHNLKHLSAAATATMNQQLQYAMGKAAASAFSDTFKVVVVMAVAALAIGRTGVLARPAGPGGARVVLLSEGQHLRLRGRGLDKYVVRDNMMFAANRVHHRARSKRDTTGSRLHRSE